MQEQCTRTRGVRTGRRRSCARRTSSRCCSPRSRSGRAPRLRTSASARSRSSRRSERSSTGAAARGRGARHYALALVRRVAVTGLGAVTPLGLDARTTWEGAVAGRAESGSSGRPRRERISRPDRVRGQGLRGRGRRRPEGGAASRAQRRARGLRGARGVVGRRGRGVDPARAGILVGSAIGGVTGVLEQQAILDERGPSRVSPWFIPNVLVDSASGQIAIDLGLRGPNYAPVSACATGSHAVGEGAELIKREMPTSSSRAGQVVHAPRHPRRLLRHARARRRGGRPRSGIEAVRRDARRLRHGRGRACSCSRTSIAQARGARVYAEVLGYGTSNDAHHMARPTPRPSGSRR